MSLEAKKASTITIKIGKAALLKKRLMSERASSAQGWYGESRESRLPGDSRVQRGLAQCGAGSYGAANGNLHPSVTQRERCDVRESAVALGVVQPVADGELVGNLETGVTDRQVHAPAARFGQQ